MAFLATSPATTSTSTFTTTAASTILSVSTTGLTVFVLITCARSITQTIPVAIQITLTGFVIRASHTASLVLGLLLCCARPIPLANAFPVQFTLAGLIVPDGVIIIGRMRFKRLAAWITMT